MEEKLYCVIVYFNDNEKTYYGFNIDILELFQDLLNTAKLSYKIYEQIDENIF